MIDLEVARLRHLRNSALRVRSIAHALGATRRALNEPLLTRGACASWRIARAVSGRLKAHPYVRYQKGTTVGSLVRNSVLARWLALKTRSRMGALGEYELQVRRLARQLEDARALTWSSDLSNTFGRSQYEIRSLLAALAHETGGVVVSKRSPQHEMAVSESMMENLAPPIEVDWPYLAF
jgi:hypothetical protein